MTNSIGFFKTARPAANLLVALALLLLALKIFILNRFPELFPGAHEAGLIAEAILASVVASYVFYLVVVHLKERSDRADVEPYIRKHATRVVDECQTQLREIGQVVGSGISLSNASLTLITDAFRKIPPYSDSPLVFYPAKTHADWFQYFSFHEDRTRESIRRVLAQLLYVDTRLVSLLTVIDDCSHFNLLPLWRGLRWKNQDLSEFASTFADYCDLCRNLERYLKEQRV